MKRILLFWWVTSCSIEIESTEDTVIPEQSIEDKTYLSASRDMGQRYCGDNICDETENLLTCPEDCRPKPYRTIKIKERIDPGWIDPFPWR